MSAETLRKAAEKLREQATPATQGPWWWEKYREDLPILVGRGGHPDTYEWEQEVILPDHYGECGCRSACHLELNVTREDQSYIATMHPGVGLALADWLDECAIKFGTPGHREWHPNEKAALAVARLILGGDQ